MYHKKRPVRVVPNLYRDSFGEATDPEDVVMEMHEESERNRRAREFGEQVRKLEALTTQQLLATAKKEGAKVAYRYGRGQREKFIMAIAKKRVAEGRKI